MALKVQHVVFLSLLLDLFAFTIPLPLFPRLVQWYILREGKADGLLSKTLGAVGAFRSKFITSQNSSKFSERWDTVLLGGLLGSLFSILQYFISPHIGHLSDRYGRKKILLYTMIGNVLSALVWIQSTSFGSYLLSRAIGGISEGNVQISIAIIADVTSPETRSRDLSLVGIAFAICFCIGPPLGAWFSTHPLPLSQTDALNIYATPALLTLVLLLAEIVLLVMLLPETRGMKQPKHNDKPTTKVAQIEKRPVAERLALLQILGNMHFYFLILFSGLEFTLTFLSFDLFDWNNAQNGRLLMVIGIISTLLQGGYVRRKKLQEASLVVKGVTTCFLAALLLSTLPRLASGDRKREATFLLYIAAACLAFTSATVVNSLNSLASLQCDDVEEGQANSVGTHPDLTKGKALGRFRSNGQLGRAIGPILACAAYWGIGPTSTYACSAIGLGALIFSARRRLGRMTSQKQKQT